MAERGEDDTRRDCNGARLVSSPGRRGQPEGLEGKAQGQEPGQQHLAYILWAITGMVVMRLFYLVVMAAIGKCFQDAKRGVVEMKADQSAMADFFDALRSSVLRRRMKGPDP